MEYNITLLKKSTPKIAAAITELLKQLITPSSIITVDFLQKMIDSPACFIFIAQNPDKKIIGTATLISAPQLQEYSKTVIEDVVVDANYRGQGIGAALVKTALNQARKLGVKNVTLTSRPSRIGANALYKKLGFEPVETNNYRYKY